MKAVWVDAGNDANYDKLRAHGITEPYYSVADPRVTAAYLEDVRARGFTPGVYAAWNWYPGLDGAGFAERLHAELLRINWLGNPAVCADIETHDVTYILAFLKRWRQLRPTRRTDWTLEPWQGGLFTTQAIRDDIASAKVGIVPQYYGGSMEPYAPDRVLLDLLYWGLPLSRVFGMYDAARLVEGWEGYAFTAGRLP